MISSTAHHLLGVEAYEEILLGRIRLGDRVRVVAEGDHLAFIPIEKEEMELLVAGQPNSD